MTNLPKARTSDILEMEAGSELIIYDLRINKMFQLNETSRIVYQSCGKISFDELKRKCKFTDDLIHLTLNELSANDLIEGKIVNHFAGMGRREVIKRVGLASMVALPLISSLIAPSASNAASGCVNPGGRSSGTDTTIFCADTVAVCSNVCNNTASATRQCCSGRATARAISNDNSLCVCA